MMQDSWFICVEKNGSDMVFSSAGRPVLENDHHTARDVNGNFGAVMAVLKTVDITPKHLYYGHRLYLHKIWVAVWTIMVEQIKRLIGRSDRDQACYWCVSWDYPALVIRGNGTHKCICYHARWTNTTCDAVVYPYEADNTRFEGGMHHLAIQRYLEVDLTRFRVVRCSCIGWDLLQSISNFRLSDFWRLRGLGGDWHARRPCPDSSADRPSLARGCPCHFPRLYRP